MTAGASATARETDDGFVVLAGSTARNAATGTLHWNAVHMQEALRQLSEAGTPPLAADIARLSPISWRHINFLGRYEFSLPDAVANGGLRPLRQPNSEWDF